jgi:hypothetical protein
MSDRHIGAARSFSIILYDRDLRQRVNFDVPLSLTAPFANRLFRELLPDWAERAREPWYSLIPHCSHDIALRRSEKPVGATSLYGTPYIQENEPPPRVSLHPKAHIRHFTVRLLEFQSSLYEGDFGVDDIFLAGAELLARRWIEKGIMREEDGPFYYTVDTNPKEVRSVSRDLFPKALYQAEGVFKLPALSDDRERTVFHKLPSLPLPLRSAEKYRILRSYGRSVQRNGLVMISASVYRTLQEEIKLSDKVEDGGYLLGTPYRQPGSPEDEENADFSWLLEITDVVQAEAVWGRLGSLLFTGETWSRVTRRRDRDFPNKKLVAWFHTHLFKASDDFGLSGMDQDLHRRFLTKPWQVAVLLNIDTKGPRVVRCFQRGPEGDLVECPFHIFDPHLIQELA